MPEETRRGALARGASLAALTAAPALAGCTALGGDEERCGPMYDHVVEARRAAPVDGDPLVVPVGDLGANESRVVRAAIARGEVTFCPAREPANASGTDALVDRLNAHSAPGDAPQGGDRPRLYVRDGDAVYELGLRMADEVYTYVEGD
jgi:hypothetical protein